MTCSIKSMLLNLKVRWTIIPSNPENDKFAQKIVINQRLLLFNTL